MIDTIPTVINAANNFYNPKPVESILRHKKQQYHHQNHHQLQHRLSFASLRRSSPCFETSSSSPPPPALSPPSSSPLLRLHQSLSSSPSSQLPPPPSSLSPPPWKSPTVQKKMAASRGCSQQQCSRLLNQSSSSPPLQSSPSPPQSSSSSSSQIFSDRLALMSRSFDLCNPCEKVLTMCALAKKMKKRDIKFFNRILDHLKTNDPCDGDDNDDDRNDDNDDDDKLEMEANDPNYVRNLSNQSRSEMITNLLLRFPLLKPGNNQAKQEYFKIISEAINFSNNDEFLSNQTKQLLTYVCIHPAFKRNEYMGLALLLNGSSGGRNTSTTNHSSQNHHHHHDMEMIDVAEEKHLKKRGKADEDSDDASYDVNESRDQTNTMEAEDVVDRTTTARTVEDKNKIWNNGNHNSPRDSSRNSLLSTCSSRDSGIYVTGRFDSLTKKCLAPSLSMPVSRELPDSILRQQGEMSFMEKMLMARRNRPSYSSANHQHTGWNSIGEFGVGGFPRSEGIDDLKPHTISSVPKIDGHARLSRTVSLIPDWLNKVNTAEDIPNPAFRMRLILGPNSSHLPLSPQSSTNSTDSNESQTDMRMMSDGKDSDWSMILTVWLKSLRLHKYAALLQRLSYDDLLNLGEDWLIQRDVTKGARDKLVLNIKKLCERPAILDTMEENLKTSPESSIQTIIIELTQMLKTPMKKATEPTWYCQPHKSPDWDNLPMRILNLLGRIRTELLVSKQHNSDSGLISSFIILLKSCTNNPCFGEEHRKKLMSWGNQVNKINCNNNNNWPSERNRNFPQRNSTSRFSGFYRTNGGHQPLERRSTALPYTLNNNNNNNNNSNNSNNHNSNGSNSASIQPNPQDCPNPQGFVLKPKMSVNRTHSAPLDGNISPSVLPNRSTLPVDITIEDTNDSFFDLDPSMEKHALGGMLQDLS